MDSQKIVELADGHGVVMNCNIEHGVGIEECSDGRLRIFVKTEIDPPEAQLALREFMERTAVCWLKQVAPHRLAAETG